MMTFSPLASRASDAFSNITAPAKEKGGKRKSIAKSTKMRTAFKDRTSWWANGDQ
jgi:hypothetical protein